MGYWSEHIVAITGAGSGIGAALAKEWSLRGCKGLALADISKDGLEETQAACVKLGCHQVSIHVVDVRNEGDLTRFLQEILEFHGRCSVLVNNAGIAFIGNFHEQRKEDFDKVMDVNLTAPVNMTRIFLPTLRREKTAHLANVSSMFGYFVEALNSSYHTSKFGLRGFTEALMREALTSYPNVKIHTVHPGFVVSNIGENAGSNDESLKATTKKKIQLATLTTSAQAASAILSAMERHQSRIQVGPDSVLLDWLSRALPESYVTRNWVRNPLIAVIGFNALVAAKIRDWLGTGDRMSILIGLALQLVVVRKLRSSL